MLCNISLNDDSIFDYMKFYPTYKINNQIYVPLNSLCKTLNMNLQIDENKKEINIQINPKTNLGFKISEITAIKIAEAVFSQFGSKFLQKYTKISVGEKCNGKYFFVERSSPNGYWIELTISKLDGKIVKMARPE